MWEPKVLVVEDELGPRESYRQILRNGYEMILMDNGRSAIEYVTNNPVDVALLDIRMPDMDGIEVLKQIKAIQPQIEVIMITGYASVENAKSSIKYGATDYLIKPANVKEIQATVKKAIAKRIQSMQYNENLSGLLQVSQLITSSLDAWDVRKNILDWVEKLFFTRIVWLALYNSQLEEIELAEVRGPISEEILEEIVTAFLNGGEGITEAVVAQKQIIIASDVITDDRVRYKDVALKAEIKSIVGLPLMIQDKVIGVIGFSSPTFDGQQTIEPMQMNFLTIFANQAAIAIHNAQMYTEDFQGPHPDYMEHLRIMKQHLLRYLNEKASSLFGEVESSIVIKENSKLLVHESTENLCKAGIGESAFLRGNSPYELVFGVKETEASIVNKKIKVSRRCNPTIKTGYGDNEKQIQLQGIISIPFSTGAVNIYPHHRFRLTKRVRERLEDISNYTSLYYEYLECFFCLSQAESKNQQLSQVIEEFTEVAHAKSAGTEMFYLSEFGEMIAGIRHDLVSALGVIETMTSQILSERENGDGLADDLRRMLLANKYCNLLLGNLSDLVHRTKANKALLDIKELIDEVLEILANQIVPNITVRKNYESHLPNIMGDRGQIQRAFMNLIENALQAMPKGGELSIIARYEVNSEESHSGGTIVVEISDTGMGISEENVDKIFNLSFSTKRESYGLGLYIVKQIVERQKGSISVRSSEGKGATFTLCFPIEDTES